MQINLTRLWPRMTFLGIVSLCSGAMIFFSAKAYIAARWDASSNPALWLKAAKLEPGNAEYWQHVAMSKQWDLNRGTMPESIRYLQKATRLNPSSSDLWMDLADAYESAGNTAEAQAAYDKAKTNYPGSSEVAWRYGSFLLYEGMLTEGYAELRRGISVDSSMTERALSEAWQANPNITAILDQLLPAKAEYCVSAVNFFVAQGLPDAALAVWNRQRQDGLLGEAATAGEPADAIPLMEALIQQDRIAEAQKVWNEALEVQKRGVEAEDTRSLVFNGHFDHAILNGGFDWREIALPGAQFHIDNHIAHQGSASMRVQFDGSANLDFQHLFQYVPVLPKRRYLFSAYVRTDQITTDRGICFDIVDPRHPAEVQVITSELVGTSPWTLVRAEVTTGADTQLLDIVVRRVPSWRFDNKLSGTVWIDDVSLSPMQEAGKDKAG